MVKNQAETLNECKNFIDVQQETIENLISSIKELGGEVRIPYDNERKTRTIYQDDRYRMKRENDYYNREHREENRYKQNHEYHNKRQENEENEDDIASQVATVRAKKMNSIRPKTDKSNRSNLSELGFD